MGVKHTARKCQWFGTPWYVTAQNMFCAFQLKPGSCWLMRGRRLALFRVSIDPCITHVQDSNPAAQPIPWHHLPGASSCRWALDSSASELLSASTKAEAHRKHASFFHKYSSLDSSRKLRFTVRNARRSFTISHSLAMARRGVGKKLMCGGMSMLSSSGSCGFSELSFLLS